MLGLHEDDDRGPQPLTVSLLPESTYVPVRTCHEVSHRLAGVHGLLPPWTLCDTHLYQLSEHVRLHNKHTHKPSPRNVAFSS